MTTQPTDAFLLVVRASDEKVEAGVGAGFVLASAVVVYLVLRYLSLASRNHIPVARSVYFDVPAGRRPETWGKRVAAAPVRVSR